MKGYNFTERVRRALAMAREESGRLRHEYVGTEHILLGLLRAGEGVAMSVLSNLSADADKLREEIERNTGLGNASPVAPDIPYTSRAKKVLELAMAEARDLDHSYVGTEHVLLGLLREEKGIAAQVLNEHGVSPDKARAETLRLLGTDETLAQRAATAPRKTKNDDIISINIELRKRDGSVTRQEFVSTVEALSFLAREGLHRGMS